MSGIPHNHAEYVEGCFRCDLSRDEVDRACHCGEPVAYGYDGDPTHHRGMCESCDAIRCDVSPGECHSALTVVETVPAPDDGGAW